MPNSCENLFHLVFDHIRDVFFVIDVEPDERFRFASVNRRFLDTTGLRESQIVGQLIQDVIPEAAHELVIGKYRQAISDRKTVHWLEVSTYPAGEKTGEVTVVPVFDAQGTCTQLVGTVHDITEHVRSRNELSKLNEHLTHVMESMGEGFATFDTEMNFTYINAIGAAMLGRTPEALIGKNCWEEFPEVIGSPFADVFEHALQTRTPATVEDIYAPLGRWFESRVYPSEEGMGIFFRDIGDRKHNEIKLKRMSQIYAALSECNQAIVRSQSEPDLFAKICRIAVEFGGMKMAWIGREDESSHMVRPIAAFGKGTEYLEGINISTDADSMYGNGPTGTAMRTHQPVWCHDFQHHPGLSPWHALGKRFGWGSVASLPLYCKGMIAGCLNLYSEETHSFDEQMQSLLLEMADDISYALGHFLDEAERGEEQAQLHMLSEALNQSPAVIVMTDLNEAIEYMNPAFTRRYGYEHREVIGRSIRLLQPGESSGAVFDDIQSCLEREGKWSGELVNVAKDGKEYIEQATTTFVRAPDGQPIKQVYAFRNITEQKHGEQERNKLQAQLQHIQKMDSIGRLAGGIAHDFNNMLGVIIAYTDLALRQTPGERKLASYLHEINDAANRSAELTRQLLTFARRQAHVPKVIGPNHAVEGTLKLLQRMIGENITLSWLPGDQVWSIYIDPSQLDQVLANLCVNARDAIGGVGRIVIETRNETLEMDDCIHDPKAIPGDYVRLNVSDNGCGIAREDLESIFEPFFTTKEQGKGTGLGLSTVYGIVEQNKGFIHVYSEPGHGTSFAIYLPRHGGIPSLAGDKVHGISFARDQERVLLVEDEAAILDVAKSVLETCGYMVLSAQSPEEAMRIAQTHAGEIHILITDMIMPGMNGRDLAESLVSQRPGMKRLYMSGYSADIIGHQGILDEGIHFIQKPFSMAGFAAKVREILDA